MIRVEELVVDGELEVPRRFELALDERRTNHELRLRVGDRGLPGEFDRLRQRFEVALHWRWLYYEELLVSAG